MNDPENFDSKMAHLPSCGREGVEGRWGIVVHVVTSRILTFEQIVVFVVW